MIAISLLLLRNTLAPFLFTIVLDYALRKAMDDKEVLADLDFADGIALLSDQLRQAQELLTNVETECKRVGLGLNGPKTKFLAYNVDVDQPLRTLNGTALEQKDDFKYLGSWSDSSEKDIQIRKALAWKALNDMARIWKFNMNIELKRKFFVATVESILLY